MHRVIRDHLEEVLAELPENNHKETTAAAQHLIQCEECRGEIAQMRRQARMLRTLRAPGEVEPRPGFYARVMERIEAEGPISIWSVFSESPFGRRIAVASGALALALGLYLFTAERQEPMQHTVEFVSGPLAGPLPGEDQPGVDLTRSGAPDRDAVLVNLVTYREQ